MGREALSSVRIHGAGRSHALQRPEQQTGDSGKYSIMRTFVRLRQILATHTELARKLEELEQKYDAQFKEVFEVIRQLMEPPTEPPRPPIGFAAE